VQKSAATLRDTRLAIGDRHDCLYCSVGRHVISWVAHRFHIGGIDRVHAAALTFANRSAAAARCSSLIGARHGSVLILNGQSGQFADAQSRTSLCEPHMH
jgi:hypothetical protein